MITLTDPAVREVKGVMAAQKLTEALLRTGAPRS